VQCTDFLVSVVVLADVGAELSVTGSNVGTAVKSEHQTVNIEDASSHLTEHSRPASKWRMYYVPRCYY